MDFKLGDLILVLDEDLSGVIKHIDGDTILIETDDGFEIEFKRHELVKINKKQSLKAEVFSYSSPKNVVSEKEQPKKNKQIKKYQ